MPVNDRREIFGWAMYDWANSAFATTVMAGFFPVFFQKFWSTDVTATETTSRLGYGSAIAGAVIAGLVGGWLHEDEVVTK